MAPSVGGRMPCVNSAPRGSRPAPTGPVPSLPLLSIQPQHQRRGGSLYDALAAGEISNRPLEHLLTRHQPTDGEAISAVDVSVWPRSDAETSPERAPYYSYRTN